MTSVRKLRSHAVLTCLPLFIIACSTGKPPSDDDDSVATGGSTSGNGSTGGSAATATGGGSATTGVGGSAAGGATGGASGSAGMGGSSGSAATGGDTSAGGAGGTAAVGGNAGSAGLGGTAGAAAASGMGGTSGTDPGICQELSAVATPQIPTVELVVDTSSSMWETTPPAWPILHDALMHPETGVVTALQDKLRFGFASYKGLAATTSETAPACATMTKVDPDLMNRDAIEAAYGAIAWNHEKWETPTNYAITYATAELEAYDPTPPGPKYILLVTDGNPNTCQVVDPQCGQDYAIKAAQDAYAKNIGLFVLGIGSIVTDGNAGCEGTGARCGIQHLQDMANAGVGAPVLPAPGCEDPAASTCQFKYLECNQDDTLTATYTAGATAVGTPFAVDTTATNAKAELKAKLEALLNAAVSCTFELDVIVTGDASLGVVKLSENAMTYNSPDGWLLEVDGFHVTLTGAACETYKAGAPVKIEFPCDPSGNPIAVHR